MRKSMEDLLDVRESKFGKGLFARNKIRSGTILCKTDGGSEMDFIKTTYMADKESHALQVDFERYVLCAQPFLFANHSCNPNCGVNEKFEMFALKDIEKGDELFWDYSTSMLERHWTMACGCGEKNCRKIVTDFDLLPHKTQTRYLALGIVFPYISQFMQQQLAKTA